METPIKVVYDKLQPSDFRYRISHLLGVRIPKYGYGKIVKELETKGAFGATSQTALIIFVLQYLEDLENALNGWSDKLDILNKDMTDLRTENQKRKAELDKKEFELNKKLSEYDVNIKAINEKFEKALVKEEATRIMQEVLKKEKEEWKKELEAIKKEYRELATRIEKTKAVV